MILPVITHEMAIAKAIGTLRGEDGKARYESFFVDGGEYTSIARSIPLRYSCLFKMTDTVIQSTLKSALDCLVHLMHDLSLLKESFFIEKQDVLESLDILGKSDPHLGHRTFLLRFQSGKMVIHQIARAGTSSFRARGKRGLHIRLLIFWFSSTLFAC
jgi:lantibiotic modifying enzyme